MRNAKVVSLLKLIENHEIVQLERFVESSYYTRDENVKLLHELLMQYYPKFEDEKLSQDSICEILYQGEIVDDLLKNKLKKVSSLLSKVIEKYLTDRYLREDKIAVNLQLAKALWKRGAYEFVEKEMVIIEKQLDASMERDENYYMQRIQLLELKLSYLVLTVSGESKEGKNLMNKLMAYHETYCLMTTLNYSRSQLTRRHFGENYSIDSIEKLLLKAESVIDLYPGITPYYLALAMQVKTDKKSLFEHFYKQLFETEKVVMGFGTRRIIFVQLINYASARINTGDAAYNKTTFELFKEGLKQKYIYYDNVLKPVSFLNIVKVASFLHEIEWVKHFIKTKKADLPTKQKKEFVELSELFVAFYEGKYKEISARLASINPRNSRLKLTSRGLELLNWYELLGELNYVSFKNQTKQFYRLLNRQNAISGNLKEQYENMVLYLQRIAKLRWEKNTTTDRKEDLAAEIKECANVMNRFWLLEKISEL